MPSFFFRSTLGNRRVKAGRRTEPGRGGPAAGLHASRDSLYRTATSRRQDRSGVTRISLQQIPRWCPVCRGENDHRPRAATQTSARRAPRLHLGAARTLPALRQDVHHPAQLVVAVWSLQLRCRRQAWDAICSDRETWEQSAPLCKDPTRLPDPSTLRRWAWRRLISLWSDAKPAALTLGSFCSHPPSLPGIGRPPGVFCTWRQTRHELARRWTRSSSRFRCWSTYKRRIGNLSGA